MIKLDEIFLPVSGIKNTDVFSEKYRVSNYGRVYNIIDHCFVKLSLCGKPQYYYVTFSHKGCKRTFRVNRLVALSFVENPKNLPICDHIGRDRLNNYYKNLRWVTRSKNQINSDRVDNSKVNYFINQCEKFVKIFNGIREDRRIFNRILNLEDRVIYEYKHEYTSKIALSNKYNIHIEDINKILIGVPQKRRKPKFKFIDVKSIYLKRVIIEKYLNGEHSRKKIAKDLQHLGCTVRKVDHALKDTPRMGRKKPLPIELRKEIYKVYSSGLSFTDCCGLYDISHDRMSNIIRKFRGVDIKDL